MKKAFAIWLLAGLPVLADSVSATRAWVSNRVDEARVEWKGDVAAATNPVPSWISAAEGRVVERLEAGVSAATGTLWAAIGDSAEGVRGELGSATNALWGVVETISRTNVDLSGYAKVDDIPVRTSQLVNDSGFVTNQVDVSGLAKAASVFPDWSSKAPDLWATGEFCTWKGLTYMRSGGGDGSTAPDVSPVSWFRSSVGEAIARAQPDLADVTNSLPERIASVTSDLPATVSALVQSAVSGLDSKAATRLVSADGNRWIDGTGAVWQVVQRALWNGSSADAPLGAMSFTGDGWALEWAATDETGTLGTWNLYHTLSENGPLIAHFTADGLPYQDGMPVPLSLLECTVDGSEARVGWKTDNGWYQIVDSEGNQFYVSPLVTTALVVRATNYVDRLALSGEVPTTDDVRDLAVEAVTEPEPASADYSKRPYAWYDCVSGAMLYYDGSTGFFRSDASPYRLRLVSDDVDVDGDGIPDVESWDVYFPDGWVLSAGNFPVGSEYAVLGDAYDPDAPGVDTTLQFVRTPIPAKNAAGLVSDRSLTQMLPSGPWVAYTNGVQYLVVTGLVAHSFRIRRDKYYSIESWHLYDCAAGEYRTDRKEAPVDATEITWGPDEWMYTGDNVTLTLRRAATNIYGVVTQTELRNALADFTPAAAGGGGDAFERLTTNDVCAIITNTTFGEWQFDGKSYMFKGISPGEQDYYDIPSTIISLQWFYSTDEIPEAVRQIFDGLYITITDSILPVRYAVYTIHASDVGGGDYLITNRVAGCENSVMLSTPTKIELTSDAGDYGFYLTRTEHNALGLARLSDLAPSVSNIVTKAYVEGLGVGDAKPNEKKVALFVITLNGPGESFTDIELKATTNNFSASAASSDRLVYYCHTSLQKGDYHYSGSGLKMDGVKLFVSSQGPDVREWKKLDALYDAAYPVTTIALLVSVDDCVRTEGEWLDEDNEELTWSYVRTGDFNVETNSAGRQIWRQVMPTRWYRELPEWAK
jgi:hypothetical protein